MSDNIYIKKYPFDNNIVDTLQKDKYGTQRPVVYILNDDNEAYVGETIDASVRAGQHKANPKRGNLNLMNIITTDRFNKSVILDLESFLIGHIAADKKYILQNGNGGLHKHNYYQKEDYEREFKVIWDKLKEIGLVKQNLIDLENSNIFKYSPYKSLTDEQIKIVIDIKNQLLKDIANNINSTFIVNGGAGTGKTILGIYLMKFLLEIIDNKKEFDEELENIDDSLYDNVQDLVYTTEKIGSLKIGLVIPMKNLRETLRGEVFNNISGLSKDFVLSPRQVADKEGMRDILIVDEAHRLRKRKNLPSASEYVSFDNINKKLGLGPGGTELDRIMRRSKYQIFLYDKGQSIKPTDIDRKKFAELEDLNNTHICYLNSQMRCIGGNRYIDYIKKIFSKEPPIQKEIFNLEGGYELKLFGDVNEMVNRIIELNKSFGLCRNIAGFSREWKTKQVKPKPENTEQTKQWIQQGNYDIEIGPYKYIWNSVDAGWISSPNSINEIGCIHTSQGFDLNYTGLIIGNDLKYSEGKGLYVDKDEYYDSNGKRTIQDYLILYEYIINIYVTMCTRGMLGTYIYACDPGLRKYLSQFIDTVD